MTRWSMSPDRIPSAWYNVLPRLESPMDPPLHPGTKEPVGPEDLMPLFPMALIMLQPDLGTVLVFVVVTLTLLAVAGVRARYLMGLLVLGVVGTVAVLNSDLLAQYQRDRLLVFIERSSDRDSGLAESYNVDQSETAISLGGLTGRGWGEGPQTQSGRVPEQQTDFIFTTFVEEWGMVGALVLLGLFALVLLWGFSIALRCQHHFGRLIALGVTSMMFLYVFINTAMVMGLLPVVGVPLPLVSNGGTALVSVMFACGLLIGMNVYRDAQMALPR